MVVQRVVLVLLSLVVLTSRAVGQAPTTVQLPSFEYFTVDTTVSVPDRGSVVIGGINSSGRGGYNSGTPFLPSQRAGGSTMGASQMSVHAMIHDMSAMDAAILAIATKSPTTTGPMAVTQSATAIRLVEGGSVGEARSQHERELAAAETEARNYFQRGQTAESHGQSGAAKVWYQMASKRGSGKMKAEIDARLQALKAPTSNPAKTVARQQSAQPKPPR
ncbi:MAG TPA: hypothetical protein VHV77_11185 [Pirellulales bacterium]|jgi:hypothetical protein|nr:hypothetical protein [Pirellulales bacterium]